MKEKIILRLRALFPGVNLRTTRVDTIAANLKITEEADIDQALKDLDAIIPFAEIAKSDDYQHTKAQREKQEKENKEKADKEKADKELADKEKTPEGAPDIAKLIQDALSPILTELSGLKAGKTMDTRKQALEAVLVDTQPKFKEKILRDFPKMKFENDEEFQAYVTETETDAKEFAQSISDQGLGGTTKPFQPAGSAAAQTQVKSDIEKWAKAQAPAEVAK